MIVDISKRICIVGLGLLGGSYAKALKRFGFHISAITKEQSSIDYALKENIIDEGSTQIDETIIGQADLVIFALYPHVFVEWIEQNQSLLKSGALITDVTGVKGCVVYKIQNMLRPDVEFIAAHPMAGREVSGVENSTEKMFVGANYIVTPTDRNTPEAIRTCTELGRLLGFSNVAVLSPEEHDEMIGFLSQLTHCIAITLMTCNDKENIEKYTGDSFRD
ncbi:MAG: prephenate dehydrogenase, partial [Clostridia bacterium]|nr:prephenate dehydrogenase [Clostridia bacterium]